MKEDCTWPPEKPTATTPSSLPFVKNLGKMVEGDVMLQANRDSREPGGGRIWGILVVDVEVK